jgi:hypothetical protein
MSDLITDTRALSIDDAKTLTPGDMHYTAYVGPPAQYDFMGASQFRLLCTLGLRENHTLLDFGCGSLRAGRLLIPYLLAAARWLRHQCLSIHQVPRACTGRSALR